MAGFFGRTGVTITDNTGVVLPLFAAAAERAAMEGGEIVRADAYERANVSPGVAGNGVGGAHMRDEIKVSPINPREGGTEITVRIGIDMAIIPYAHHQEFGSRGKPFLRPAIDENREAVRQRMREVMREELGGARVGTLVRFRRFA